MHAHIASREIFHSAGLRISPEPARRQSSDAGALGVTRSFAKDEQLFVEGDDATHFYRVISGAVRTYKLLSDGRRQIDAFHLSGDIFGVEAGDEHRFSADAVCDSAVVSYRRCSLDALAMRDGSLSRQIVATLLQKLERAQEHILLLGRRSALEKMSAFLLDISARLEEDDAVELPMSRIDIADHLGLTIETVSRTLTQLERQGVIEVSAQRRTIVLRDRAALSRMSR